MGRSKRDLRREALRKNVHAFALNCSIRRTLRPAVEFNNGGPGVIVLVAPEADFLGDFVVAAIAELGMMTKTSATISRATCELKRAL